MLTALVVSLAGDFGAKRADALDALWDFDGDLTPTLGSATMSYRGDMGTANVDFFASEHDLGLPMPFGDRSVVMRFQPTTELAADGNDDGVVDQTDLAIWKEHFGEGAGATVAANVSVPEPAGVAVAAIGLAVLAGGKKGFVTA